MSKTNELSVVFLTVAAAVASFSSTSSARADTTMGGSTQAQSQAPPATNSKPERMDVDAIRRKYWERGDDNDARVIQNRAFTKAMKVELGAYYGSISTDPFLSVRAVGASLGFHLTEAWGINLLYWKDFVSASSAQGSLQSDTATVANPAGDTANTNPPKAFMGGELAYSPIYGKISLFGAMIIHYDLHVLGGYGINNTQSGNYGTLSLGIGQQFYLTHYMSLRLDYRAMHFSEDVQGPNGSIALAGRSNWTDVITLGVTAFVGGKN